MEDGRQPGLGRITPPVVVVVVALALNFAVVYHPPLLECRPIYYPHTAGLSPESQWTCEPVGRSMPLVGRVWRDDPDGCVPVTTPDSSDGPREYVARYQTSSVGRVYYAKDHSRLYSEVAVIWAVAATVLALLSWRRR